MGYFDNKNKNRPSRSIPTPLCEKEKMKDDDFLQVWVPLETTFRTLEDRYRSERLRKNGKPVPEGPDADKMNKSLSSACEVYINATEKQRELMRELFRWSYLLPPFLFRFIKFPKTPNSQDEATHAARIALAAVSLEDNKTDYRDMFMSLGALYLNMAANGLNPLPFFQEAASWSSENSESGPGGQSMKVFLTTFNQSEFFRTSVEPRLSCT